MTWRITTGSWINWPDGDPDWLWIDETYDDWRLAQLRLISVLYRFKVENGGDEGCEHCVDQAVAAINSLADADDGDAWHEEVDGHDYTLNQTTVRSFL